MANKVRLIDAEKCYCIAKAYHSDFEQNLANLHSLRELLDDCPTVDAVEVVHGEWVLTAHKEYANCRWNVTAECSECHHRKGEVYAGFFVGFHDDVVRDTILDNAKSVKRDNYCPNCGAKMDGDGYV